MRCVAEAITIQCPRFIRYPTRPRDAGDGSTSRRDRFINRACSPRPNAAARNLSAAPLTASASVAARAPQGRAESMRAVAQHPRQPEPSYEEPGFNPVQREALAVVINELRREFVDDIERMQQRILQTMARMVLPGEIAEQKVCGLSDHIALMERQIERRLAKAITDKSVIDLPRGFWKRSDAA
jgi:hypothetical protein